MEVPRHDASGSARESGRVFSGYPVRDAVGEDVSETGVAGCFRSAGFCWLLKSRNLDFLGIIASVPCG